MNFDTRTPARRARFRFTAALLCLSVLAVACGSDDEAAPADRKPDSELAAFCEATLKVEEAGRADAGEDVDAAKAFGATMATEFERLLAVTPASVRSDVETLLAATKGLAETGDGSAFGSSKFAAAARNWHKVGVESCGWNITKVSLTEYKFDGIPDTMSAGITSFELTNEGSGGHSFAVYRRNDGIDSDFAELLAKPDDAGFGDMTEVGSGFVEPGEPGFALAELTPGDYLVICSVHVGDGDGPPEPGARLHYQEGMQHEFTVG